MIKKTLKIIALSLLSLIAILVVGTVLFLNLSPEFGGSHSDEDKGRYAQSGHYEDGQFENLQTINMDMSFSKGIGIMYKMLQGIPNSEPSFEIPVQSLDSLELTEYADTARLIWFGHSAFLLQIDGKNVLIDPMFGDVPAPHPFLGNGRYNSELPIAVEKLPMIDLMIISHDHYDHLDYGSFQKLKDKTKAFFVPLGVGAHFKSWGIDATLIHELNWWDEMVYEDLKLIFAPSQHFSGRGLSDRSSTLWGSWIIQGQGDNIYFSGDGGYGPHFKEIGEKYGPFDFAMMECGQYNDQWKDIHMIPEETAQAAVDVKARVMMPIHWGSFTLAMHTWTDPVIRVTAKANELKMPIIVPIIGEKLDLHAIDQYETKDWWNGH